MTKKSTTDPQNELLAEVDKNNQVIGSISRKIAHNSPNKIYRTVAIFVKNDKGEYLWQKRSSTKDLYPNCWDFSVGGHVNYGKSYLETAVKELEEELGIIASAKELRFIGELLVKLPTSNEFFHVFEYNFKPSDKINLMENEVSETMWMSIEQVKKSMQQQKLKWYPRPLQVTKAFKSLL